METTIVIAVMKMQMIVNVLKYVNATMTTVVVMMTVVVKMTIAVTKNAIVKYLFLKQEGLVVI